MDLIFYNGAHSVTIGEKNSWTDWHLIPSSKPVIPPPAVNTKMVELPGTHGSIDLTRIFTGYPMYKNRTGSLEFILAPGYDSFETTKMAIMGYLHGYPHNLYLADDPNYYYTGLFTVNAFKSDAKTNGITINYDLYPFKYRVDLSNDDWLWDPFNFETDYIRELSNFTVRGSKVITITDCAVNTDATVISHTSGVVTITNEHTRYDGVVDSETYQTPADGGSVTVKLKPGANKLTFTASDSTVSLSYRGTSL